MYAFLHLLFGLLRTIFFLCLSQAASGQQATGSAFGESVDLSIDSVFSLVTVDAISGPLPVVESETPPNFSAYDSLLGVDVNANIKLLGSLSPASLVDILSTGVLEVTANGRSDPDAVASASVANVSLELLGSLLLPVVLGVDAGAISSEAVAGGTCGALTVSGDSTLTNASLASSLGALAGIVGALDANPAPNTVLLDIALLGGRLRIVLNEQIVTGNGVNSRGITVNALHITLEDLPVAALITDVSGEIIISQSRASVTCSTADLSVVKTDDADPVVVGSPLTYTLAIDNAGPDTADNVTVEDTLPGNVVFTSATSSQGTCNENSGTVSCNLGSIANGGSATVDILVTPDSVGNLSNTASVVSDAVDPDTSDNSSTQTTEVSPLPGSADLAVSITESGDPITAGNPLTITLGVSNAGPDDAISTQVAYTLPSGVTLDSVVPSQGSCVVDALQVLCDLGNLSTGANASVAVLMQPLIPAQLVHFATVGSNVSDPNLGDNVDTEQTTVQANSTASANLTIVKSDVSDPVQVGENLSYALQVSNNGPDAAAFVVVSDALPASLAFVSASSSQGVCDYLAGTVTCNLGAMSNGAIATIVIVTTPDSAGALSNTATVASDVSDPDPSDNSDEEGTAVHDAPADSQDATQPVPALSATGLTFLMMLLAGAGWTALRRRT